MLIIRLQGRQAAPVVLDHDAHAMVLAVAEGHVDFLGVGMPDRIGDRLAHDLQHVELLVDSEAAAGQLVVHRNDQVVALRELAREVLQRGGDAAAADLRAEGADQLPDLAIRAVQSVPQFLGRCGGARGRRTGIQAVLQPCHLDFHVRERLSQRIVQLASDRAALFQQGHALRLVAADHGGQGDAEQAREALRELHARVVHRGRRVQLGCQHADGKVALTNRDQKGARSVLVARRQQPSRDFGADRLGRGLAQQLRRPSGRQDFGCRQRNANRLRQPQPDRSRLQRLLQYSQCAERVQFGDVAFPEQLRGPAQVIEGGRFCAEHLAAGVPQPAPFGFQTGLPSGQIAQAGHQAVDFVAGALAVRRRQQCERGVGAPDQRVARARQQQQRTGDHHHQASALQQQHDRLAFAPGLLQHLHGRADRPGRLRGQRARPLDCGQILREEVLKHHGAPEHQCACHRDAARDRQQAGKKRVPFEALQPDHGNS